MKDTKVINLFGGPGAGKSTTAYCLAGTLKSLGVSCELALEYAKDLTWSNSLDTLDDQVYVFGKQYHRIYRLYGKVDCIVTDSPLLLSLFYGKDKPDLFDEFVKSANSKFNNVNFFIVRNKEYVKEGRNQTSDEAELIDKAIVDILLKDKVEFYSVLGGVKAHEKIIENVRFGLKL
jgi:ABC-type oligopeptide transport system ATPase subunit